MIDLARAIAGPEAAARSAAGDVLDVLRASGAPLERDAIASIARDVPDQAHAFARALERSFGREGEQPMAVDLSRELGVGERQIHRRASDHFRRFHLSVSSWREYVTGIRISVGTFLMSAPDARSESVARYLGYSSPSAFCHALRDHDLPSPQAIQRAAR